MCIRDRRVGAVGQFRQNGGSVRRTIFRAARNGKAQRGSVNRYRLNACLLYTSLLFYPRNVAKQVHQYIVQRLVRSHDFSFHFPLQKSFFLIVQYFTGSHNPQNPYEILKRL